MIRTRSRFLLPRLSLLLGGLGGLLLLAPAAHAQSLTLNDGDVVTVDGTGTHGTVNNSTASYDNGGVNFSYAVQTNGTAIFTLGSGAALDGGEGGDGLDVEGSGLVTITGGSITTEQNGIGLNDAGTGPVMIAGGSISGGPDGTALLVFPHNLVSITGGIFTAGQFGVSLNAFFASDIDLYGSFDGLTPGQTQTLPSNESSGSFSGTLENNAASQTFTYHNDGTITLHDVAPAPEPSQFAALAIGLLGLSALALKARKRQPA